METYRGYEEAIRWVIELPFQDPSVINASIVSAAQGRYGNYYLTQKTAGSTLWINPLMSLYWFLTCRRLRSATCSFRSCRPRKRPGMRST